MRAQALNRNLNRSSASTFRLRLRLRLRLGSKDFHRLQNPPDPGNLMRAKQIRLAERRQHREERFRAAYFLAEELECVRQRVANRKTQGPQPKRVEEHRHLLPYAHCAVLA